MAYNTAMLEEAGIEPPTNWEELQAAAEALTSGDQKAFCLNHSLDRALAFIYQNGGALLSDDKSQNTFDSQETRDALTTYSVGSRTARRPARPTSATTGAASPSARARSR